MPDREYFNNRRKERRQYFIDLLGGKCSRCGNTQNLHFDHKNPKIKKFRIADNIDAPMNTLLTEVKKCVLMCDKCHREKTKEKNEHGQPKSRHGTIWMYKRYHCRCPKCRQAMKEYNQNKRLNILSGIFCELNKQADIKIPTNMLTQIFDFCYQSLVECWNLILSHKKFNTKTTSKSIKIDPTGLEDYPIQNIKYEDLIGSDSISIICNIIERSEIPTQISETYDPKNYNITITIFVNPEQVLSGKLQLKDPLHLLNEVIAHELVHLTGHIFGEQGILTKGYSPKFIEQLYRIKKRLKKFEHSQIAPKGIPAEFNYNEFEIELEKIDSELEEQTKNLSEKEKVELTQQYKWIVHDLLPTEFFAMVQYYAGYFNNYYLDRNIKVLKQFLQNNNFFKTLERMPKLWQRAVKELWKLTSPRFN